MDMIQIVSVVLLVFIFVLIVLFARGLLRGFSPSRDERGPVARFVDLNAEIPTVVVVTGKHELLNLHCVKKWESMYAFSHFALNEQKDVLLAVSKNPEGAASPVGEFQSPVDYAFPVWTPRQSNFDENAL